MRLISENLQNSRHTAESEFTERLIRCYSGK